MGYSYWKYSSSDNLLNGKGLDLDELDLKYNGWCDQGSLIVGFQILESE